ncbi:hypothetical protein ZWY2020_050975 [Hordeum vulgare]|nr:hypothetical protein ZWY2020_050975 [Hordeum vulgare]
MTRPPSSHGRARPSRSTLGAPSAARLGRRRSGRVLVCSLVDGFYLTLAFLTPIQVDCPFPPSGKIGINSVQRENEEIVPMRAMKMARVPYVPLEDRLNRIDSLKTKIFTLGCTQRRSALKHLREE